MIRLALSHLKAPQRMLQTSRWPARGLAIGALSWLVIVVANYYTQLWSLLGGGTLERPHWHGDLWLPHILSAAQRATLGLLGAGVLVASAIVLGRTIGRIAGWRFDSWREDLPVAAALGIGVFTTLGLALAGVGLYTPPTLRALAGLPLLVWLGWRLTHGSRTIRIPDRLPRLSRSDRVWIGCTLLALGCALIAALAPEREYDALWYHLAYPQRYLQQGRLVDLPDDYVSLYPMTWELWFGYGLALGGQTAATLLHFACLPLTALVTYQLARRFVPGASAWLAVALLSTTPTVIWEASTAYVDLALALHVTLALYSLLRYDQSGRRQWLLIAALNLGLALATKHLALVVLGLACVGLTVGQWRRERDLWRALRPALALGLLSLLLPLPWYLRSWLAAHNPVFPELYWLFGAPPERWDAVTDRGLQGFLDQFGRERTLRNLLTLPWHVTMHASAYHGLLGPLFLLLLPGLWLRRWRRGLGWLLLFVLGFGLVWASPLASFQLRFLVPIVPALACLAAASFARLHALLRRGVHRRAPPLLMGTTALLLVLNLPPFTALHERDRVGWQGWINSTLHGLPIEVVVGGESREGYLGRMVPSFRVWRAAERLLSPDARVLTWSGGDEFYTRLDRVWINATALRPTAWAGPQATETALHGLRAHGITHLIIDQATLAGENGHTAALTRPDLRDRWYETLYSDKFYHLYRIRWEALAAEPGGQP